MASNITYVGQDEDEVNCIKLSGCDFSLGGTISANVTPNNTYGIATRGYVDKSIAAHDVSESAHDFLLSSFVSEINGQTAENHSISLSSIRQTDPYGEVISELNSDGTGTINGSSVTYATMDTLTSQIGIIVDQVVTPFKAASGNWNYAAYSVSASSGVWNDTYTETSASSANWNTTFATVSAASASWAGGGEAKIKADSVYATVSSCSSDWQGRQKALKTADGTAISEIVDTTPSNAYANRLATSDGIATALLGKMDRTFPVYVYQGEKKYKVSIGDDGSTIGFVIVSAESFPVIQTLQNSVNSNTAAYVYSNESYYGKISAVDGCTFQKAWCTMGGVSQYVSDDGTISIDSVTGNIAISGLSYAANRGTYNEVDGTLTLASDSTIDAPSLTSQPQCISLGRFATSLDKANIIIQCDILHRPYTISYTLDNATSTNTQTEIQPGAAYSTQISTDYGYAMQLSSCTMDGIPQSMVNGFVNISNVNGNIAITAIARLSSAAYFDTSTFAFTLPSDAFYDESSNEIRFGASVSGYGDGDTRGMILRGDRTHAFYSVTNTLDERITTSNPSVTAEECKPYYAILTPAAGYAIDTVTCTMGGVEQTVESGVISIESVDGPIAITATSKIGSLAIYERSNGTLQLASDTKVTLSNANALASTFVLKASDTGESDVFAAIELGKTVSFITSTGTLSAQGSVAPLKYTVTNSLTHCTTNNSATEATENSQYNATITADEGYTLGTVTCTMGGVLQTVTGGVVSIAKVTGNIVITASAIPPANYLSFSSIESGSELTVNYASGTDIAYNKNEEGWVSCPTGTKIALATVGDTVQLSGNGITTNDESHFTTSGRLSAGGSATSLMDGTGSDANCQLTDGCFSYMFCYCDTLVSAPELPSVKLADSCYKDMFVGCASLTSLPSVLPAETLKPMCYNEMFCECTSITSGVEMHASQVASACCERMYKECSLLSKVPELTAAVLAPDCYSKMFSECNSLSTMPNLPATTLADRCYMYMLSYCDELTSTAFLPATSLAEDCYAYMIESNPKMDNNVYMTGITEGEYVSSTHGTLSEGYYIVHYGKIGPNRYSVTNNLPNCTTNNSASTVPESADYSATIAPSSGYAIDSIVCTMGRVEQTVTGNTISIANVTGDIVITAVTLKVHSISNSLTHCTTNNSATSSIDGASYNATITADASYTITSISCTMGGVAQTVTDNTISIAAVTGDIVITATAEPAANYLAFSALQDNSSVTLNYDDGDDVQYSKNGGDWTSCASGTTVNLESVGDVVRFKGSNVTTNLGNHFTMTGLLSAGGSITSLVDGSGSDESIALDDYCFKLMFSKCSSLACAPEIKVGSIGEESLKQMFSNCTSLTSVGPIVVDSIDYCGALSMFEMCTSLKTPPSISVGTLGESCFMSMFSSCKSLTSMPSLTSTELENGCYYNMFNGCTSLVSSCELPATTVKNTCYGYMFSGCTSLTAMPVLSATTLGVSCYSGMFNNCTSLKTATSPYATTLANFCYQSMFMGCTALETPPTLSADTLASGCYYMMFQNCSNVTSVDMPNITEAAYSESTHGALDTQRTIDIKFGNWLCFTAVNDNTTLWLQGNGSSLPTTNLEYRDSSAGSTWDEYEFDEDNFGAVINLSTAGDKVWFRTGSDSYNELSKNTSNYYSFYVSTNVKCSGNVQSLVLKNMGDYVENYSFYSLFKETPILTAPELGATTLGEHCYDSMFRDCTSLSSVPDFPDSTMSKYSCMRMFYGCTSLSSAPALPSESMDTYCYGYMFQGCTSLTDAPSLESESLSAYCYYGMFYGCTALTGAPELTAVNMLESCYSTMFYGCSSLETPPSLPSVNLAKSCYYGMFYGCSSLSYAPELPATILYGYCYKSMFERAVNVTVVYMSGVSEGGFIPSVNGPLASDHDITIEYKNNCLAFRSLQDGSTVQFSYSNGSDAQCNKNDCGWTSVESTTSIQLDDGDYVKFRGTNIVSNGTPCFTMTGKLSGGGSVTSLIDRYGISASTPLSTSCFNAMFKNCTSLVSPPELPSTVMAISCYSNMFERCSELTSAPVFPTLTSSYGCFNSMFYECRKLESASDITASYASERFCSSMYFNCVALKTPPVINVPTTNQYCYQSMFYGCTALTAIPELPAESLLPYCYHRMFYGCTSLNGTVNLENGKQLGLSCYASMFGNDTGVTTATMSKDVSSVYASSTHGALSESHNIEIVYK